MSNTIISKEAPDFSFTILENRKRKPDLKVINYNPEHARLRSVGEISSLLDMHTLMSKSLEIIKPLGSITTTGSDERKVPIYSNRDGVWFAPDFPEFLLPKTTMGYTAAPAVVPNAITWGAVRKEPGTVSGTPFRGTQEVEPRPREYIAVFSDSNKRWIIGDSESTLEKYGGLLAYVKIEGQAFDNLVQYNIWSKSNYEVEKLVEWFEDYMYVYKGMFREAGIVNLWYNRRVRDDTLIQMDNGYHLRSVLYYIRTEKVRVKTFSPIKEIDLNVSVNDISRCLQARLDNANDTNLYQTILNRWHK